MIFLDTYSLVKMAEDESYLQDYSDEEMITLSTNIIEFHQVILRNYGLEVADLLTKKFSKIMIEIPFQIILAASNWKYDQKPNFSYADALGYHYALENNIKFITGDRAFEGFENVSVMR